MTSTQPGPQTWSLRLKSNRTTILLHIDPLQSLSSIKQELLKAIAQTHPDGRFHGQIIPAKASDILLAKPVDINNLDAGWESIELDRQFDNDDEGGKGKGKAVAKSKTASGRGGGSAKDSAQGAGLRDGGVVAFKFRQESDSGRRRARVDEDGDAVIDIDIDGEDEDGEWDVVVPSLDEGYGDGLPTVGDGDEVG